MRRVRAGLSAIWYVVIFAILVIFVLASWAGARYSASLQAKALGATSEKELKSLLKNTWVSHDPGVLAAIASNRKATPSVLREVSQFSSLQQTVRLELADNPNTPADVLRDLVRSDHGEVASRVAVNPNAPHDVVRAAVIGRQVPTGFAVPLPRAGSQDFYRSADAPLPASPSGGRQPSSASDLLNRLPRPPSSDRQPR